MLTKIKYKNCAICGDQFKLYNSTVRVCSWECKNELEAVKAKKEILKEHVNKKEQPLTVQALVNLLQIVFNKYIRTRDVGKVCVSCLGPYNKDFHAGHLNPAGNCWKTRFNEKNVFGQCPECNTDKNGNLDEYRVNVLLRITKADLEELDQLAKQNANFDRVFLLGQIELYKAKTDKLEKKIKKK
jgi:hypothetical protein